MRIARHWGRLLDGERPWGSFDVQADRFGVTRYRLTVYPPGINAAQRRRLRVWRAWPAWGAALWIIAEIVATHILAPWPALATSTAVALIAGAAARQWAGPDRDRVRTRTAAVLRGHADGLAEAAEIVTLANALTVTDSCRARGEITAIDHEVMWWRVYDQLTPSRSTPEEVA